MRNLCLVSKLPLALLMVAALASAQTAPSQWGAGTSSPVQNEHKSGPAPKHDISGIWDPGDNGIQQLGSKAMPEDGNLQHQPPLTIECWEALNQNKPST